MLKQYNQWLSILCAGFMVLFTLLQPVSASDVSIRTWDNAIELLESKVLEPLSQEVPQMACESDIGPYTAAYLDKLHQIRGDIDAPIYLILKEVGGAINHEMGPLEEVLPCDKFERWPLLEAAIQRHLNYTANIIAIIQTATNP